MKQLIAFSLVVILLFGGSCKTSHQTEKPAGSMSAKEEKIRFKEIIGNQKGYKTFSSKVNLSIMTSAGNISSKATIRMLEDSMILISVQPLLGVEMFRLQLTNESIKVVDKMNKRYLAESLSRLSSSLPDGFSVSTIQSIFLNRLFLLGQKEVSDQDFEKFEVFADALNELKITPKESSVFAYNFTADKSNGLTQTLFTLSDYKLDCRYSNFQLNDNRILPLQLDIAVKGMKKPLNIGFSYLNIEWNKSFSTDFSIPSQYKKMSLEDLIKMFMK